MGAELNIAEAMKEPLGPSAVFNDVLVSALEADEDQEALVRMERALANGERKLHAHIRSWRSVLAAAEKARAKDKSSAFDSAINALLDLERHVAKDFRRARKLTRAVQASLKRRHPSLARRTGTLLARMDEIGVDYLEMLRNLRWETMSDQAREDPEPTGPALDSPSGVRRHLDNLLA